VSGSEELAVVPFVGFPDPVAGVDVLGEVYEDVGEVARRVGRQVERVVGEVRLASLRVFLSFLTNAIRIASRSLRGVVPCSPP